MNKIRTVIVDDDQANLTLMKILLENNCPELDVIEYCITPQEAIEAITNYRPELVFIDVEMPGLNGFELLEQLGKQEFDVIFVTAHDEYSLKAFKYSAIDYLIKPAKVDDIKKAVERVLEKRTSNITLVQLRELTRQIRYQMYEKPRLALNTHERVFFVNIEDIIRCEASGVYTVFHMNDGKKHMISKNIQKFEEALTQYAFYRAHRSHIINMTYVKEYVKEGEGYLLMSDGAKVEVSRYRKDEVLKKLGK
ncbi:MAG: response regulator transcription factor [Bacteroidetes bacterium]|nr:response regulator transcription factor [Bacteroidota bacterium]